MSWNTKDPIELTLARAEAIEQFRDEYERAELVEDCDDIAARLRGAANREIMERMAWEIRRLRIAHLRRMSDAAFLLCAREEKLARTSWEEKWRAAHARKAERFIRFSMACRAAGVHLTRPVHGAGATNKQR